MKKAKEEKEKGIYQYDMDNKSLNMLAYLDLGLANHADLSTQFGYVVFLTDATSRVN